jgi:predicted nucleotidyltransferase
MGIDQKTIDEIVRRVLSVTSPDRIILFGSAASGKMTRDSDIDLLILKREPPQDRAEWLRITRALRDLQFPFDILLMAANRFEESKEVVGGIAYPANKYGKVIYEAA